MPLDPGVTGEDIEPGMSFSYENAPGGFELWTVLSTRFVGVEVVISYLRVNSRQTSLHEFKGRRDAVLWREVRLWKRPA